MTLFDMCKHFISRPQTCVLRQIQVFEGLEAKPNIRCRSDRIIKKMNSALTDGISGFGAE